LSQEGLGAALCRQLGAELGECLALSEVTMKIRLFGPVTVEADGNRADIGGPLQQLVLAILASIGGHHVPADTLIDQIWPLDDPDTRRPQDPRRRLHELIYDVRIALSRVGRDGQATLVQRNQGYCLAVDRDGVDLLRFHDLRHRADDRIAASDDGEAVRLFRDAFRLWGGDGDFQHRAEPFAGLSGTWVRHQRVQLGEAHRTAVVHCAEAELRLGRHRQLIPELVGLSSADPLNEHVAGLLMCAYYGAGQTDKALEVYARFRERFIADIGNEPGAQLRELHRRVLKGDPGLSLAAPPGRTSRISEPAGSSTVTARQLLSREEQTVNNVNKAEAGATVWVQAGVMHGDVNNAPRSPEPSLNRRVRTLGRELRTAHRDGRVSGQTATAAEAELNRALACLETDGTDIDGFVAALENVQRLADGADRLVDLVDDVIDAAHRGHL
jgi:DNA-binding SARP family transcriptional activator